MQSPRKACNPAKRPGPLAKAAPDLGVVEDVLLAAGVAVQRRVVGVVVPALAADRRRRSSARRAVGDIVPAVVVLLLLPDLPLRGARAGEGRGLQRGVTTLA